MTFRTFLAKIRRKILYSLFGKNLYVNHERINSLESLIRDQANFINEQAKRIEYLYSSIPPPVNNFFSQDGEDMVLRSFYEDKPNYKGFYVDMGAHHPFIFSNTSWFYEQGWTGINIDAAPGSMNNFRLARIKDINLEIGISNDNSIMDFYIFDNPAVNSFDKKVSEKHIEEGYKLKEIKRIECRSINDILNQYLPKYQKIDFISIDVEGFEEKILKLFDFDLYSPDYFLIEELEYKEKDFAGDYMETPIYLLLKEKGYIVVGKTKRTVIFKFSEPKMYTNKSWDSLENDPYQNYSEIDINDNIEKNISRVSFEISNICNYSKIHKQCPASWCKSRKKIDSEIIYKVIDELAELNFQGFIAFHRYNEPLLDKKELFFYIEYVNKTLPFAKIFILTNGYYLYQEDLIEFEKYDINCIYVSSYNYQEHNRLSALETKIPYKVFYSKLDDRGNIYERVPYDLKIPCYATVRDITINCNGELSICCLDWDNQEIFGDLHKNSLKEIMNSEKFLQVHSELVQGNRKLDICRRCNWQR